MMSLRGATITLLTSTMLVSAAQAQDSFFDVGSQAPITILINPSPWFGGFEAVVDLYQEQTGNEVILDVTPFSGIVEKARNAVRDTESVYDLLNLDTSFNVEFYEGGFLEPLKAIDPTFELPPEVLTFGDSGYWSTEKDFRTADGGELMAYSPNGNVQLLFYRRDLYEEADLAPPKTWQDVMNNCQTLQDQPNTYGMISRGERGNAIRFNWTGYMLGHGASIVRDPEGGDFTVTINSPEAKEALDLYLELAERCGPPNVGSIGQTDMIQSLITGKGLHAVMVVAAWPSMDDPQRSAVVGKIGVVPVPGATPIGNWHFGIPKNIPDERKQAAIAFSKWFLTFEAQMEYARAGGVPVRRDVFTSELADQDEFRWMKAYLDSMPTAHQVLGYKEAKQVEEVMGLRLNQALIGELGSAKALNLMADEIQEIFVRSGRTTGQLPPLPE